MLEELIHESNFFRHYKLANLGGPTQLAKLSKFEGIGGKHFSSLMNEWNITKDLDHKFIRKVFAKEIIAGSSCLIMEYVPGTTLLDTIAQKRNTEKYLLFLKSAIQTAEALEYIHRKKIIHKNITSEHILFDSVSKDIKLINFSKASVLSKENTSDTILDSETTNFEYISPEQTGRMNRSLDNRSDLYSLGVSFYEILSGVKPFKGKDALEIIYGHLAIRPVPITDIIQETFSTSKNKTVLAKISQIINKLMEKEPENRYATAEALKFDLEQILELFKSEDLLALRDFEIGSKNTLKEFKIPEKLYGRDKEKEELLKIFERTLKGTREIILLKGPSGIGKTSLVNELYKPITKKKGYFLKGKFENFDRSKPYSAFLLALKDLIKIILNSKKEEQEYWKERILSAFGENYNFIFEIIPEFELILPKVEETRNSSSFDNLNRFKIFLFKIFSLFADAHHPVTLFLDDVQWGDSSSLTLMTEILLQNELKYFCLICSYRQDEVDSLHPLNREIHRLENYGFIVNELELKPLNLESTTILLKDIFNANQIDIPKFSNLCLSKTAGNPFCLGEYLKKLEKDGAIFFDTANNQWEYNLQTMFLDKVTSNVLDILTQNIESLSRNCVKTLAAAAVLGNNFSLKFLARLTEESTKEIYPPLVEALSEGYLIASNTLDEDFLISEFRFSHDKVRDTFLQKLQKKQLEFYHYRAGTLYLLTLGQREIYEKIFEIAYHFNSCPPLITEKDRQPYLEVNYLASKKSFLAGAYSSSFEYITNGIQKLNTEDWEKKYYYTLNYYEEFAVIAAQIGDTFSVDLAFQNILIHGKTLIDQAKGYIAKIKSLIAENNQSEAWQFSRNILTSLGVDFPQVNVSSHSQSIDGVIQLLNSELPISLLNNKEMFNPEKYFTLKILSNTFSAIFQSSPEFYPFLVCEEVKTTIVNGNTTLSPFIFARFGLLLCGIKRDYRLAFQFAELALALLLQKDYRLKFTRTYQIVYSFIYFWSRDLSDTLDPLLIGYTQGLENGDLEYSSYCICVYFLHSFHLGHSLESLAQEQEPYYKRLQSFSQKTPLAYFSIYYQACLNLIGDSKDMFTLKGKVFDEEGKYELFEKHGDKISLFYIHFLKAFIHIIFKKYDISFDLLLEARKFLPAMNATLNQAAFHFYWSFLCLVLQKEKAIYSDSLEFMEHISKENPNNFLHQYSILEALQVGQTGNIQAALDIFQDAIYLCEKGRWRIEEALCNEQTALFLQRAKLGPASKGYVQRAESIFHSWGCSQKSRELIREFPQFFENESTYSKGGSINFNYDYVDLEAYERASIVLNEELNPNRNLQNLMHILLENSNSDKLGICLVEDFLLSRIAHASKTETFSNYEFGTPISDLTDSIPSQLINYSFLSKTIIFIPDIRTEKRFKTDLYISASRTRTYLAIPLLKSNEAIGCIYLESTEPRKSEFFEHLSFLKLVAAQAAISIDNAITHQKLEDEVWNRTQELQTALSTIQKDLRLAKKIQESVFSLENTTENFLVSTHFYPMEEVGGDFLDIYTDEEQYQYFFVADATGHGVQAALVTMLIKNEYDILKQVHKDPGELLNSLDTVFSRKYKGTYFFTCALAVLNPQNEELLFCSAGHPNQILVRKDNSFELLDTDGRILGLNLTAAPNYKTRKYFCNPGDRGFLFSDGIMLQSQDGILFDTDMMLEILTSSSKLTLEETSNLVIREFRKFLDGSKADDDVTLLAFEKLEPSKSHSQS